MKDKLITAIQMRMAPLLDTAQQAELQRVLAYYFHDDDLVFPVQGKLEMGLFHVGLLVDGGIPGR